MIKTLAFDLDGTLTGSNMKISKNLESLLSQYTTHRDIYIATGRTLHLGLYYIKQANIKRGYLICNGGAITYSIAQKEVIKEHAVDPKSVQKWAHIGATKGFMIVIFLANDSFGYALYPDAASKFNSTYDHNTPFYNDYSKFRHRLGEAKGIISVWLIPLSSTTSATSNMGLLFDHIKAERNLAVFKANNFLHIISAKANKYGQLLEILNENNTSAKDVVYFGDGMIDIECLQNFGYGVAMGNSLEPVKKAADETTLSNDDDGVFYWLMQNRKVWEPPELRDFNTKLFHQLVVE